MLNNLNEFVVVMVFDGIGNLDKGYPGYGVDLPLKIQI